jgi:hypothetical protein
MSVFKKNITAFKFRDHFALRRKNLKCLDKFIKGPVWVFEVFNVKDQYFVSITPSQFANLWGAFWAESCKESPRLFSRLHLERGFIIAMAEESSDHKSEKDEIRCHYSLSSTNSNDATNPPQSIPFSLESHLLIGMQMEHAIGSTLLHENKCCQTDTTATENKPDVIRYAGTSKEHYEPESRQAGITSGLYVSGNAAKTWKRYPGNTLKGRLLVDCKAEDYYAAILNLRVGLEVSVCTSNSERISLWDALVLANKKESHGSAHQSFPQNEPSETCLHSVGAATCIQNCWRRKFKEDTPEVEQTAGFVLEALERLSITGVDSEDTLQVYWPFSKLPKTMSMKSSSRDCSHNWVSMLRESMYITTFAVASKRCLEYENISSEDQQELRVCRKCSNPNARRLIPGDPNVIKYDKTVLSTTIVLDSRYVQSKVGAHDEVSNRCAFKVGDRINLYNTGRLKIVGQSHGIAMLAKLEGGILQNNVRGVTDILLFKTQWMNMEYLGTQEQVFEERILRVFIV